jgi:CDP-diacylglycerol---glycerol-3-phosphate 3-phosphatidyltransferase
MILIISRVIIGIIIFLLVVSNNQESRIILFWLIIVGFLTDFFDGYIARLLGISNQKLRRLDTLVDRVFWLSILCAVWIISSSYIKTKMYWIILVLVLEIINYLISYIRFRKEISTHAILSKLWAVTLVLGFCDLVLNGQSKYLFDLTILFGIISRLDTGLIMLILPRWDHDIPSFYHAIKIRKGKEIKRIKLFNG